MKYKVRASYSHFRPDVVTQYFHSFIGAWLWGKWWTWKHQFALVLIEKVDRE